MTDIQLNRSEILSLPDETLLLICSHLHYKELISLSKTCKRLHRLCGDDDLWRRHCKLHLLDYVCTEGLSWKEHFVKLFIDIGKYPDYKEFKGAWDKIKRFLKANCPSIFSSLQDGVSEADLDRLEEKLDHKLPADFRVSHRLCDGQNDFRVPGLFGGSAIHTYSGTFTMFSVKTNIVSQATELVDCWKQGLYPLACLRNRSQVEILYALSDIAGFTPGCVYSLFKSDYQTNDLNQKDDYFCYGTFKEWLMDYADKLDRNAYYVHNEQIYKFYHEPSCVATTAGITVSPAVCFIHELSTRDSYHGDREATFFFAYRITISMSEDTPKELSSQLETRHWIVTDDTGAEEHVNGPGVIGEFPIMKPGEVYSWISCCTLATPTGNMKGHFRFRNLATGELTDVECPCYEMDAPAVLTYQERERRVKSRSPEAAGI